ncbi:MAG: hypothetical protein HZA10_02990 [Nitrospirae bacterium]|nr:hypothetical protein [Nitrospirota bacterium]
MISGRNTNSRLVILCMTLALILISTSAFAVYQTNLSSWGYIMDGSNYLDASNYSVPTMYDWNSDGLQDLLVGQNNGGNGYVSYYQNYGTATSPVFNGFSYISRHALRLVIR